MWHGTMGHGGGLFRMSQSVVQFLQFLPRMSVNMRGKLKKVVSAWMGPRRVVDTTGSQDLYGLQDVGTGEREEVHADEPIPGLRRGSCERFP